MTSALSMLLLQELNREALGMCLHFLNSNLITDVKSRQTIIKACRESANIQLNISGLFIMK